MQFQEISANSAFGNHQDEISFLTWSHLKYPNVCLFIQKKSKKNKQFEVLFIVAILLINSLFLTFHEKAATCRCNVLINALIGL